MPHPVNLTSQKMLEALACLDRQVKHPMQLIVGGGGAMILAHHHPLVTTDIDAVPARGTTTEELDPIIKAVAAELGIQTDWMNPHYATFTHVLPSDYADRLLTVYEGKNLRVLALSLDDLLIMKCFAGRLKDRNHAKVLIEKGARVKFVESHIESLKVRGIPGCDQALDFLDEVQDLVSGTR